MADGRGGDAVDLAAGEPQEPGELDVLVVEEAALVPSAQLIEEAAPDHEGGAVQPAHREGSVPVLAGLAEPAVEPEAGDVDVLPRRVDPAGDSSRISGQAAPVSGFCSRKSVSGRSQPGSTTASMLRTAM